MSKTIWKKLGSPELISSPEGILQNVLVELGSKTILIDIEVIDTPLDYKILFGRSYM
jgi:hypothetical protein